MYILPKAFSKQTLPPEKLRLDRKFCTEYEDFGLGEEALYLEYLFCNRMGYIPLSAIERVYKRLGVSKGFYEGKMYGTLCYLVVRFDGQEKAYRMTHEENLDALLAAFREKTKIPVGKV
ncbi:MAG: hypothetical protein J6V25_04570 [Oscillospiraceae bacterium]|nr:hypothetical protein [Oscillospiraceae bacterium]